MNESILVIGGEVNDLSFSLIYFPFCLLTLFVLVYYVRRRYILYREIKIIPQDRLYRESYKNHLKNLTLKCIINNFIIIILMLEFVRSICYIIGLLPDWFITFAHENTGMLNIQTNFQYISNLYITPLAYSFVPVLSLFMNFLWLAYRKFEYKYTIIRWIWYIIIRAFLNFMYNVIRENIFDDYRNEFVVFYNMFFGFFVLLDFIQYLYYSRKFYLHLKSREKEIRLFYFDNTAYLDIKYIRFHFKIATILVGIALFFYTVGFSGVSFLISSYNFCSKALPQRFCNEFYLISSIINVFICVPSRFVSIIIFTFNYLYMFMVVVYKSYRNKKKKAYINNYIKPIVKQYQDRFPNYP